MFKLCNLFSKKHNDPAFIEKLISAVPSERQYQWQQIEYYNFIHFGMNTVMGVEWGDGKTPVENFNPVGLDTDQWVESLKASGSRGIILTAKHHDGFCLFPSKYTDYTVENSPYKEDICAKLAESCKKYDVKFGLYLSPWDMHEPTYGTDEYNDFFCNQLEEICTRYGDIFAVWFDGACGEGPNGKKQVYDFPRFFNVVRKHQPNAVTCICGVDVRWIGNEDGAYRKAEWSVVPQELRIKDLIAMNESGHDSMAETVGGKFNSMQSDLGSRHIMSKSAGPIWYPAEMDVSITKGWFYLEEDEKKTLKSLDKLVDMYYGSVGGNSAFLLNVAPNKQGLISPNVVTRLKELGDKISADLANVITSKTEQNGESYTATLNAKSTVKIIILQEDIRKSQRVEKFNVYANNGNTKKKIATGEVIGHKRIIRIATPVVADSITIEIVECRKESYLLPIQVIG